MKTIKCKMCGREFTPTAPNNKYCGLTCKYFAERQRRKAWETENPDYNKKYGREYRKRQIET